MTTACDDNDDGELAPWADPTPYGPAAGHDRDFWAGTEAEAMDVDSPFRGWCIRRLWGVAQKHAPEAGNECWSRVVLWLVEEGGMANYFTFPTALEYRPGQPGGAWTLSDSAVARDLPKAFAWARTALGATQSLDEFLADPIRFAAEAPREDRAIDLLTARGSAEACGRFYDKRNRIHRHWPRACAACGAEFRPENRKRIRCPDCLNAARAKRRSGPSSETMANLRRGA